MTSAIDNAVLGSEEDQFPMSKTKWANTVVALIIAAFAIGLLTAGMQSCKACPVVECPKAVPQWEEVSFFPVGERHPYHNDIFRVTFTIWHVIYVVIVLIVGGAICNSEGVRTERERNEQEIRKLGSELSKSHQALQASLFREEMRRKPKEKEEESKPNTAPAIGENEKKHRAKVKAQVKKMQEELKAEEKEAW